MFGRIADAFYLLWSMLYWNARKTRFRAARGRVACPCQSPSDSGRAWETRCDAALPLRARSRFRHVCPLLQKAKSGEWLCSVDTPDVRPFWGRALGLAAGLLLGSYLVLTLAAWCFLRGRDYSVAYTDVAWPPRWSEFNRIQSELFARRAEEALRRNDPGAALMALSIAFEKDPANYSLGRVFAAVAQGAQPGLADRVYVRLVQDHPERRRETWAAWYPSLLARGDFGVIASLARSAIEADPQQGAPWINALLFALRREPDAGLLAELASTPALGPAASVFALEASSLQDPKAARAALLRTTAASFPYLEYYRIRRLIELGDAASALRLLNSPAAALTPKDLLILRLEAYTALDSPLLETELATILAGPMNAVVAEALAAFFVRHPDAPGFAEAFDGFRSGARESESDHYASWSAWLCAAGTVQDFERFAAAAAELRRIAGSDRRILGPVEAFFRERVDRGRVELLLPALQPLPLDVIYAMLERFYVPHSTTRRPDQP